MVDKGNMGDWIPPTQTAFDQEAKATKKRATRVRTKTDQFANDIVPLAFAIGVSLVILAFLGGLAIWIFKWLAGI